MSSKYFFKNLFNRKKIIILLTFQAVIYIFFLMNLLSFIMFKHNFIEDRNQSFPMKNGAFVKDLDMDQIIDNKNNAVQFIDYIENNGQIKNFSLRFKDRIDTEQYNIDTSKLKAQYLEMEDDFKDVISLYRINYGYYSKFENYISGNKFNMEDFEKEGEYIPLILGSSYKGIYNIGDIITNNVTKFKVSGFLEKDFLIMKTEPAINVEKSSNCFFIPLTESFLNSKDSNLSKSMKKMTFEFSEDADNQNMIKQLEEKANELGLNFEFSNFKDDLNKFLSELESQLLFEIMRATIFTLLSLGVFTLSFIYLINNRKREIGILYSLGASKINIIFMICMDMLFIINIAYIISIPIYMYTGKGIFDGFVNSFNIFNLGIPYIVIIVLSLVSLVIPIRNVIKMRPNELIRGN